VNPNGLVLSGNTLYGTAWAGGAYRNGAIFAVNTDGTGFTNLLTFTTNAGAPSGLVISGDTLYGTVYSHYSSSGPFGDLDVSCFFVFKVSTDGTGFTYLGRSCSSGSISGPRLILSGNTLYGKSFATWADCLSCPYYWYSGVFALHTDGTGSASLYSSSGGYASYLDPDDPELVLAGDTLYGTMPGGYLRPPIPGRIPGTLFSLSFRPQLTIMPSGQSVVVSWPTNYAGFDYTGYALQSTTNVASPVVWSTNLPAPIVVNGQNTVTNPISGPQQFYRLIR
jgi:uncharacterized repeat protein (TIGR03803 family)